MGTDAGRRISMVIGMCGYSLAIVLVSSENSLLLAEKLGRRCMRVQRNQKVQISHLMCVGERMDKRKTVGLISVIKS